MSSSGAPQGTSSYLRYIQKFRNNHASNTSSNVTTNKENISSSACENSSEFESCHQTSANSTNSDINIYKRTALTNNNIKPYSI
jgi:hypothetical protein